MAEKIIRVEDLIKMKVRIPKNIVSGIDAVKYLVVFDWAKQVEGKTVFEAVTSAKFNDFVYKHVDA